MHIKICKTFDEFKEEAKQDTKFLPKQVLGTGEVSWRRILEMAVYDELVYNLTVNIFDKKISHKL